MNEEQWQKNCRKTKNRNIKAQKNKNFHIAFNKIINKIFWIGVRFLGIVISLVILWALIISLLGY